MISARSLFVGLSVVVGAVSGCGSSSATPATTAAGVPSTATPASDVPATSPVQPDGTVSAQAAAILGKSWLLDSMVTVGGLQPVPAGHGAGLRIGADGRVEVNTGCNTGSGKVTFTGESAMSVGPLALTRKACADDVSAMEAGMLANLAEPLTWSVQGDVLTLIPTTITDVGLHFTAT